MTFPPYTAPPWLPGGHAQTLWPLAIKPRPLPLRRERWDAPDGDFIDVDRIDAPAGALLTVPLVVLFHGLEGSARSHYAISLARAIKDRGWRLALPHFRGCSGELNRLPRAYHSGDSAEIDWILARLRAECPGAPLYAIGVSLGGNALLKWAGEWGSEAGRRADAVAAVSAPLDLAGCGHHLTLGFNQVYTRHFLRTLKAGSAARLRLHPGLFDEQRMRRAVNLYEFDDAVTAPIHGFAGADDYWRRASAKPWLPAVRLPALVLNALNDPFLPARFLPGPRDVSASVRLECPGEGGHVGFVGGNFPGHLDWLPQRLLHYFQNQI